MDKLERVMEIVRDALNAHPFIEGEWQIWDGLAPAVMLSEGAQLGHGIGRRGRVLLVCEQDATGTAAAIRGVVLTRSPYGTIWEVDDGRGIIERGSARRLADVVDQLWPKVMHRLANPARVAHAVLETVVQKREGLAGFGRVGLRPGRVTWGPLEATFTDRPAVLREGFTEVVARELLPTSLIAHQAAAVLVHMAEQSAAGKAMTRRSLFGADRALRWGEEWRPDGPPAALRDATAGAKRTDVDGQWRERLKQHLQAETDQQRKRRMKVVEARLQAEVHLPAKGADPTGKAAGGWYGATGADRLPVPTEVVAALWVLGFGGRVISEIVVGSRSAKSAIGRRLKELRAGREGLEPATGAQVLDRLKLEPPRPAAAPGAPSGRGKPSMTVSRRGPPPFHIYINQIDAKAAGFVCNLPERAFCFIKTLYQRREMTLAETLEVLDLSTPKALSGITGSIGRWAPVRGVAVPFERVKQGNSLHSYRWIGFPTPDAADSAEDAA